MSVSSTALAVQLLHTQATVRNRLGLPFVEDVREVDPPEKGQLRFWAPNWSAAHMLAQATKLGLAVTETEKIRHRGCCQRPIDAGYYTVPLSPPTCGSGKFRKADKLKPGEIHAPLGIVLMAALLHYAIDIEDYCPSVWLATCDKVDDKIVCVVVNDGTLTIELHDPRLVATNGHATAVMLA